MTRLISVRHSPVTQEKEPERECRSRCRRGTRAFGVLACGYALNCEYHRG